MTMANGHAKILLTLFALYGQEQNEIRIKAYMGTLQGIPAPVLDKACKKLALESKFLPAVSEIVSAAESLLNEANGMRVKGWDEAWEEILMRMEADFYSAAPAWSTPEIAQAVNAFGWKDLRVVQAKDMQTVRAQVRQMYESACKRAAEKKVNDYVLGITQNVLEHQQKLLGGSNAGTGNAGRIAANG